MATLAVDQKITSPWWGGQSSFTITQLFGTLETVLGINAPHTGIDIGMPTGTALMFPSNIGPATVVQSGYSTGGFGNTILLKLQDGSEVRLGHLNDLSVKVGQILNGGELLGHSDSTGASTGPHLHFEIDQNGKPVDPTQWLLQGSSSAIGSALGGIIGGAGSIIQFPTEITSFFSDAGTALSWLSNSKNWWKIAIIGSGVVLILIGTNMYFFGKHEMKLAVGTVESGKSSLGQAVSAAS